MLDMSPWRVLMALKNILFVCTGNVCRSPMAEGLFRHMVANRPDIRVRSAGVSTFPGQPPSPHAVDVLADLRIDISKLRSLPLSEELVQEASCIIAMTRSHMESIHYLFPEAAEKTFLLREFEDYASSLDVSDPIGMGRRGVRSDPRYHSPRAPGNFEIYRQRRARRQIKTPTHQP